MLCRISWFLFLLAVSVGSANAHTINVSVTNSKGEPVSGAVVSFKPANSGQSATTSGTEFVINQKNIAFDPFISLVPVDSIATFKNEDTVLHHVYSFSKAKRFNLKLFGTADPQEVTLDAPGVVSIGCNIHDGMVAYIYVSKTDFAAQTDDDGKAALDGIPEGEGELVVWHPLMKGKGNAVSQNIIVTPDSAPVAINAKFRHGIKTSGGY